MRYFVDTETTGLDPQIHWAYEVALMSEYEATPRNYSLPHTLDGASLEALNIGNYFGRGFAPWMEVSAPVIHRVRTTLRGHHLVGWNVGFDAAFIAKGIGLAVWDYHLIDVAQAGMWLFGHERPMRMVQMVEFLTERGHEGIPEPDHTASGDVLTLAAIWGCLLTERQVMQRKVDRSDSIA